MANVFDTISFNKWADSKKEEEIDKESKRRRNEQIKRLRDQLRKQRELRENGIGTGDLDLDALIEALQRGEEINAAVEEEETRTHHPTDYGAMNDDDILEEIRIYQKNHVSGAPMNTPVPEPLSYAYNRPANDAAWKYNRRQNEAQPREENSKAVPTRSENVDQQKDTQKGPFRYNRIVTKMSG